MLIWQYDLLSSKMLEASSVHSTFVSLYKQMHSPLMQLEPLGSPTISEAEVNREKASGQPTAMLSSDLKVLKLPRQAS